MTSHRFEDNPSLEIQVAVFIERVSGFMEHQREANGHIEEQIKAVALLQKEQNGNVARTIERVSKAEGRLDLHDKWHGANDESVAKRVQALETAEGDRSAVSRFLNSTYAHFVGGGGIVLFVVAVAKALDLM